MTTVGIFLGRVDGVGSSFSDDGSLHMPSISTAGRVVFLQRSDFFVSLSLSHHIGYSVCLGGTL